jgi:restriction system protein
MKMPTFDFMMNPLLKALHELGGSGTISEIDGKVLELLSLPEEIQNIPHNPGKSDKSEVEYRLAWTKTYLKKCGLIENSGRGVWSVISDNNKLIQVEDTKEVIKKAKEDDKKKRAKKESETSISEDDLLREEDEYDWKDQLLDILKEIEPDAFERLTKRLLREAGFEQVEVTGKSGDEGIDGKGIAKINGIMSFHVYFQCKRYKGSVGSKEIRDFRGAMVGRADKGIFLTTGNFTRDAVKESTRDGAPPIDLIDGDTMAEMLKELRVGIDVEEKMVEEITIKEDFYKKI